METSQKLNIFPYYMPGKLDIISKYITIFVLVLSDLFSSGNDNYYIETIKYNPGII